MATITVITDTPAEVEGQASDGRVFVPLDSLEATTGWHLEERGLCRHDVCVPVADAGRLLDGDHVDLAAFGEAIGHPTAADADEGVVAIVPPAAERAAALESLEAPRVTLRDLDGNPIELPGAPNKKKLLVAWASW